MNWCRHIPATMRTFLLQQPLPDAWIKALKEQEHKDQPPQEKKTPLKEEPTFGSVSRPPAELRWSRSWDKVLLLVILVVSAVLTYLIART